MIEWTPWGEAHPLPADDTLCDVITPGGDERQLVWYRNLWFLPDKSMYVYFVPTFWRPAKALRRCGGVR